MPIRFAFSLKPWLWSRSRSLSRSQDLGWAFFLELGIVPGAEAQLNQEPKLRLKFRTGSEAMAIWNVANGPFPHTNSFAK